MVFMAINEVVLCEKVDLNPIRNKQCFGAIFWPDFAFCHFSSFLITV